MEGSRMSEVATGHEFTVVTWNVAGRIKPAMLDLLVGLEPDIAFLQEVKVDQWSAWKRALHGEGLMGLELRPREADEGGKRGLGAAVLLRPPLQLAAGSLVQHPGFAWPERAVTGLVTLAPGLPPTRLVAYHALHGGHGRIKPQSSAAMASWLAEQRGPVLVGMDANSPEVDHPDESSIEAFWAQASTRTLERSLVGPRADRAHHLNDVWRTYLAAHPEIADTIRAEKPHGPLAVTHWTGRHPRVPRRYDHIWASDDFEVLEVDHVQEGISAGSDHAVVRARLGVTSQPPRA